MTFCENISKVIAKPSTEHSVPKTASIDYTKKIENKKIHLFTPTLYIGN